MAAGRDHLPPPQLARWWEPLHVSMAIRMPAGSWPQSGGESLAVQVLALDDPAGGASEQMEKTSLAGSMPMVILCMGDFPARRTDGEIHQGHRGRAVIRKGGKSPVYSIKPKPLRSGKCGAKSLPHFSALRGPA